MEVKQGMGGGGDRKVNTGPNWQKILTPIVGFLLLLMGGVVSYILSDPATAFLKRTVANFPTQPEVRYVVAVGVFLILMLVLYMVYAVLAPKPKATTTEAALDKEKKEKQIEMERAKKRQIEMKQRMKQANRNKKE
jgi:type VI protein secretion system component VasK